MTVASASRASRAEIDTVKLQRLNSMLEILLRQNLFCRGKLEAAGVTGALQSLCEFTARVPFTFKKELAADQEDHPPYGSNLSFPVCDYTRFSQTSGTTGVPLRWLDDTAGWGSMLECWIRVYESAGVNAVDRVFFPFSFGPFLGFWVAFEAASRLGCLSIPGGGMRSVARLRTMLENDVTVLCSTPTYAIHLAQVAARAGIRLSDAKVRTIIVAGEPGGSIPATRGFIEELWPGARVVDHHGMTEIGPVTYECPKRPSVLHVMEAAYHPEVIDGLSLEPVEHGGPGELVLTNLSRVGSPILRYRTGDLVRLSEAPLCECGSQELALEGGILGRSDDMVIVRGVNLFPSAVEQVVRSCGGVAEYQVETLTGQAMLEMIVHVEPDDPEHSGHIADRIRCALQDAFGLRVAVNCVPAGALPRFDRKAARWKVR